MSDHGLRAQTQVTLNGRTYQGRGDDELLETRGEMS